MYATSRVEFHITIHVMPQTAYLRVTQVPSALTSLWYFDFLQFQCCLSFQILTKLPKREVSIPNPFTCPVLVSCQSILARRKAQHPPASFKSSTAASTYQRNRKFVIKRHMSQWSRALQLLERNSVLKVYLYFCKCLVRRIIELAQYDLTCSACPARVFKSRQNTVEDSVYDLRC